MAEIQHAENRKRHGGQRSKKLSTKVDLTPMVDLGFLLITFFVFTSAISRPTAMKLVLPAEGKPTRISASKTLNLILAGGNKIFYYDGDDVQHAASSDYSAGGIRSIIQRKKSQVQKEFRDAMQTIVLIKPTANSSYQNIINALDEMEINGIKIYMLADADARETAMLRGQ